MGKIKLYELAKDLDLTSKELLEKAVEMGIAVKSHLSSLEDEDVEKLKKSLNKKVTPKKAEKAKSEKKEVKQNKSEKDTPVIIRREVIIDDNEKKEETKTNQAKTKIHLFKESKIKTII